MTITSAHIARFQMTCQNMVAEKGKNGKSMPKKRDGKGRCTKPAHNPLRGTLRKCTKRLHDRQHGMQTLAQTPGYRKPGSMTR